MKKICVSLVVNGISLYVLSQLFSELAFQQDELVLLTAVFGLLNITIKPILKVLSFPITLLTFGLFSAIINGFVLSLALDFATNLPEIPFMTSVIAGIVLSILNTFLHSLLD